MRFNPAEVSNGGRERPILTLAVDGTPELTAPAGWWSAVQVAAATVSGLDVHYDLGEGDHDSVLRRAVSL